MTNSSHTTREHSPIFTGDTVTGDKSVNLNIWFFVACAFALLFTVFFDGISKMVTYWTIKEEYSHGFFIPLITLYLIRQKANQLSQTNFDGSWVGFYIVVLSVALYVLGEMSSLYILIQYGFLSALLGMVLSLLGFQGFKLIWIPLMFLVFMVPLPNFLYNNLSLNLQLLSSALGVEFIRFCDISVHLEGNVIDLGRYQLQVVDACSGLRYLFPFMSLSFLSAYVYNGSTWKKVLIFLSSVPITILMNSFRIGIIGVLVEYYGTGAAEGFIHDFEGWVIFMFCMMVLFVEMWLLANINGKRQSLSQVLDLNMPPWPRTNVQKRTIPVPAAATLLFLLAASTLPWILEKPVENAPRRESFLSFPLNLDGWSGHPEIMKQEYQDKLKLDDYLLANFDDGQGESINYYVAYYASQSKGRSIHSPRSCLPGGGWIVTNLPSHEINVYGSRTAKVARVLIQQGDFKQLVYFWTQQRGRILNNEYAIKWYLFWDGLMQHRTDGALIRMTTQISDTEDLYQADARLTRFAESVAPLNSRFVPN